jgi:hypothetical protein
MTVRRWLVPFVAAAVLVVGGPVASADGATTFHQIITAPPPICTTSFGIQFCIVEEHVEINGVITGSGNRLLEMSGSATEVTTDLVTGEVISTDVSFGHSSQLSTMDGTFLQRESALTSDTFTGPSS